LTFNPDKTVVLASKFSIAKNIVTRLAKRNIFIKVATTVRDLGIDAGAGARRATKVMKCRIKKAVTRLRKTRGLVKASRFARKLITTGSQPSWQYGVEAYGITDACVSRLRAATAFATGIGGSKGCPITAIRLAIGERADPLFAATLPSVKWWIDLWNCQGDEEAILRRTWDVARDALTGDSFTWAKVKGPVATIVANLLRLGWKPICPDKWLDCEGQEWEIVRTEEKPNHAAITEAILKSCTRKLDSQVSSHRFGKGAEGGFCCRIMVKHLEKLGSDNNFNSRGLLGATAAGGMWPPSRIHEAKPEVSPVCKLCGEPWADETHLNWKCKVILEEEDVRIQSTNYFAKYATRQLDLGKNEIYWNRGLVPDSFLPEARTFVESWKAVGSLARLAQASHFGTDGSGGKFSSQPRLRACGAGIATVKIVGNSFEVEDGIIAGVGGTQTVPRSELTAIVLLLSLVGNQNISIVVDASYIFKGLEKGKRKCLNGCNGDLWGRFWEAFETRGGHATTKFIKVKSHSTPQELACGCIEPHHFALNEAADFFAEESAREREPSDAYVNQVKGVDSRAWRIQSRLTAVAERICREPREKVPKPKPAPRVKTTTTHRIEDLRRLGHDIVKEGTKYRCTLCMRSFGKSSLINWIRAGECEHSEAHPFSSITSSFNLPRIGVDCSDETRGADSKTLSRFELLATEGAEGASCERADGIVTTTESNQFGSHSVGWKTVGKVGVDLGRTNQTGFKDWEDLDCEPPSFAQEENSRLERERDLDMLEHIDTEQTRMDQEGDETPSFGSAQWGPSAPPPPFPTPAQTSEGLRLRIAENRASAEERRALKRQGALITEQAAGEVAMAPQVTLPARAWWLEGARVTTTVDSDGPTAKAMRLSLDVGGHGFRLEASPDDTPAAEPQRHRFDTSASMSASSSANPQPQPQAWPVPPPELTREQREVIAANREAAFARLEAKRVRDWHTRVVADNQSGSTVRVPPGAPAPRIRHKLKTRIVYARCRTKRFAPQQFSGFVGSGRRVIHSSHSTAGGRGVVWCWRCGCIATSKPRALTKACKGGPSVWGAKTLARLRRGQPPYGMLEWPRGDQGLFRQLQIVENSAVLESKASLGQSLAYATSLR
jgi:hypothetical protein